MKAETLQTLLNIGVFGFSVIVHELGHYVAFRLFGYKPNIKINIVGIVVGENVWLKTKAIHAFLIYFAGVFVGLIPLIAYDQTTPIFMVTYVLVSSFDIVGMLGLISLPKNKLHLTMKEILLNEIEEIEEKYGKVKV